VHKITGAHDDTVTYAKFSPCEKFIVSTSLDQTVKVWDIRTWKELYGPPSFEDINYSCPGVSYSSVCISPDSQYIVCGSKNGAVCVLNTKKDPS
jgi:WD40 repeat protein